MKLGVCYYPEHWPEEMWPKDAAEMHKMGISLVRIGEFAWSRIQPDRHRFDWSWLDRAIDTLAKAGLKVIIGTPSATPPRWLITERPDILAVDAAGAPRNFGSRRHYCFSSSYYRDEAAKMAGHLAERYGHHPAVYGWQIDNEYGCHETVVSYSKNATVAFREWCAEKYKDINELNRAWGNVFWSMEYTRWDDILPPVQTVTEPNPAHTLDWRRFSSDQVTKFNQAQVQVIRKASPSAKIMHNSMGFFTEYDHYDLAKDLDGIGWDSYPLGALDKYNFPESSKKSWVRTGHPDMAAFHHDLYRGIGTSFWGVLEQQPGPVNWADHNPVPLPGMVRLWSLEAFAHGADFVSYFRWRQFPRAQEQMHAGLKRPDNSLSQGGKEAITVSEELSKLQVAQTTPQAPIALIFDYESQWLFETQPQGQNFSYISLVFEWYSACRKLGLNIDVVGKNANLSGYKGILVPSLPISDDKFIEKVKGFDGFVVFGPRTCSKTSEFSIPAELAPGGLRKTLGFKVCDVESLRDGLNVAVEGKDLKGSFTIWREYIEIDGCEVIAKTKDGAPAVLAAKQLFYVAGWPDEALLESLFLRLTKSAGLKVSRLEAGLRYRHFGDLSFAFNYGPEAVEVSLPDNANIVLGDKMMNVGSVLVWKHS